jgi:hypothetical protein
MSRSRLHWRHTWWRLQRQKNWSAACWQVRKPGETHKCHPYGKHPTAVRLSRPDTPGPQSTSRQSEHVFGNHFRAPAHPGPRQPAAADDVSMRAALRSSLAAQQSSSPAQGQTDRDGNTIGGSAIVRVNRALPYDSNAVDLQRQVRRRPGIMCCKSAVIASSAQQCVAIRSTILRQQLSFWQAGARHKDSSRSCSAAWDGWCRHVIGSGVPAHAVELQLARGWGAKVRPDVQCACSGLSWAHCLCTIVTARRPAVDCDCSGADPPPSAWRQANAACGVGRRPSRGQGGGFSAGVQHVRQHAAGGARQRRRGAVAVAPQRLGAGQDHPRWA